MTGSAPADPSRRLGGAKLTITKARDPRFFFSVVLSANNEDPPECHMGGNRC